jgi:hypothetical protein
LPVEFAEDRSGALSTPGRPQGSLGRSSLQTSHEGLIGGLTGVPSTSFFARDDHPVMELPAAPVVSSAGGTVTIEAELPGVKSAAGIDAGFADAQTFELEVDGVYQLTVVRLESAVQEDDVCCKFDKATAVLTVSAPLAAPTPPRSKAERVDQTVAVVAQALEGGTHAIVDEFLNAEA